MISCGLMFLSTYISDTYIVCSQIEEPPPGGRPSKVDSKVASENEVQAAGDIPSTHKHINTLTEQGTHGNQIQRQSTPVYTTGTGDKRSQVAFSGTKANIPDSVVTMDSAAYVRTADKDFLSGSCFTLCLAKI